MIKIFFQQPTGFLFEITEQELGAIKKEIRRSPEYWLHGGFQTAKYLVFAYINVTFFTLLLFLLLFLLFDHPPEYTLLDLTKQLQGALSFIPILFVIKAVVDWATGRLHFFRLYEDRRLLEILKERYPESSLQPYPIHLTQQPQIVVFSFKSLGHKAVRKQSEI
ncbi:Uncharacterised protein [Kingella denitrificans]|uniref:Uncharacterized protein n=1 Tax=Kingella denitrificans ATCC 33394 TaxID=888741 RepID=F0EYA6_9NEIS|nr:hypothetical protein [Kingella denitrificans]EGC17514.1 hypothetical protein HMPREF9098_0840 [Kingella denitrificans ATCC 33394]QQB41514.1 hypothetical protein I6I17_08430 [Kingella denitrificans]STR12646.1 Uncharacterised protein [Kingella denitrificans]